MGLSARIWGFLHYSEMGLSVLFCLVLLSAFCKLFEKGTSAMSEFEECVVELKACSAEWELDECIERFTYNDNLTNAEYCELYKLGLERYHEITGE